MWDSTHSDCHDIPVLNSGDLVTDLVYPDPLGSLGPLTVFLSFSVLDCDSHSHSSWSDRVPVSVGKPQLPWYAHPLGVWAEGRWVVQRRAGCGSAEWQAARGSPIVITAEIWDRV